MYCEQCACAACGIRSTLWSCLHRKRTGVPARSHFLKIICQHDKTSSITYISVTTLVFPNVIQTWYFAKMLIAKCEEASRKNAIRATKIDCERRETAKLCTAERVIAVALEDLYQA